MKSSFVLGVLVCLTAVPATQAVAESPTVDELKATFSGHVRKASSRQGFPMTTKFNADGTADSEIETPRGIQRLRGTWQVQGNDTMCIEFPATGQGGGKNCVKFEKEGQNVYVIDDQGKRTTGTPIPIRK
jgi:hypothetical protein